MLNGMTRLVDLSEKLNIVLHSNINETIGGWLSEKLDRVPEQNDSVKDGLECFVLMSFTIFK